MQFFFTYGIVSGAVYRNTIRGAVSRLFPQKLPDKCFRRFFTATLGDACHQIRDVGFDFSSIHKAVIRLRLYLNTAHRLQVVDSGQRTNGNPAVPTEQSHTSIAAHFLPAHSAVTNRLIPKIILFTNRIHSIHLFCICQILRQRLFIQCTVCFLPVRGICII